MSADAEDRGDDPATALPSVAEPRELGSDRRHLSKTEEVHSILLLNHQALFVAPCGAGCYPDMLTTERSSDP